MSSRVETLFLIIPTCLPGALILLEFSFLFLFPPIIPSAFMGLAQLAATFFVFQSFSHRSHPFCMPPSPRRLMHRGMTPKDMCHVGLFMLSCEHEMHIVYLAYIPFSIFMRMYLKVLVELFQGFKNG